MSNVRVLKNLTARPARASPEKAFAVATSWKAYLMSSVVTVSAVRTSGAECASRRVFGKRRDRWRQVICEAFVSHKLVVIFKDSVYYEPRVDYYHPHD